MSETWRRGVFLVQCLLLAATAVLVGLQYRTLVRLQNAELEARAPGSLRPISIDRVFSFPEVTCAPKPVPVFTEDRAKKAGPVEPTNVTMLARENFQYGLLLSACLLGGLLLGVGLSTRAAQRESRLAQMKSSFVSNVSHEMKTPLATIQMFADTLESGRVRDPQKVAEYTRVIGKESRRLGQLLEDVLDFSRMEADLRRYRLAPLDAGALVERIAEEFQGRVEMAGGTLEWSIEHPLPMVEGDSKALGQALLVLLENALKYSPAPAEIRVRVGSDGGQLRITVTDHGIGIPASEQQRIFEKFYRVEAGGTHEAKGAGLGLAIARHVMDAHRGGIEVWSEPGRGSRFTMVLPVRKATHVSPATEAADRRG